MDAIENVFESDERRTKQITTQQPTTTTSN